MRLAKHIATSVFFVAFAGMLFTSCAKDELDSLKNTDQASDILTPDEDFGPPAVNSHRDGELDGGDPNGDPQIGDNEDLGSSGTTNNKGGKLTNTTE